MEETIMYLLIRAPDYYKVEFYKEFYSLLLNDDNKETTSKTRLY